MQQSEEFALRPHYTCLCTLVGRRILATSLSALCVNFKNPRSCSRIRKAYICHDQAQQDRKCDCSPGNNSHPARYKQPTSLVPALAIVYICRHRHLEGVRRCVDRWCGMSRNCDCCLREVGAMNDDFVPSSCARPKEKQPCMPPRTSTSSAPPRKSCLVSCRLAPQSAMLSVVLGHPCP